ncbi:hypothetical protein D3C75_531260 [compost metagenome]
MLCLFIDFIDVIYMPNQSIQGQAAAGCQTSSHTTEAARNLIDWILWKLTQLRKR